MWAPHALPGATTFCLGSATLPALLCYCSLKSQALVSVAPFAWSTRPLHVCTTRPFHLSPHPGQMSAPGCFWLQRGDPQCLHRDLPAGRKFLLPEWETARGGTLRTLDLSRPSLTRGITRCRAPTLRKRWLVERHNAVCHR